MKDEPVTPYQCKCGKRHSFAATHYDRLILECGRPVFILRPKRNGPLVAVPHPGQNLTREEMKQKYPEL